MSNMIDEVLKSHIDYVLDALKKMKTDSVSVADVDRARRDNLCRIGVWLENIAPKNLDNGYFLDVCAEHSAFHNEISAILENYIAGCKDASIDAVLSMAQQPGGCFSRISGALRHFCEAVDGDTQQMF